jgi:hypothetical protein
MKEKVPGQITIRKARGKKHIFLMGGPTLEEAPYHVGWSRIKDNELVFWTSYEGGKPIQILNTLEGKPKTVEGKPKTVEGKPKTVEGKPKTVASNEASGGAAMVQRAKECIALRTAIRLLRTTGLDANSEYSNVVPTLEALLRSLRQDEGGV